MSAIEQLRNMLDDFFHVEELIVNDTPGGEAIDVKPIGWDWTWLTIYKGDQPGIFTLWEAIPDTLKGIDIEDEKLIKAGTLDEIRAEILRIVRERNKALRLP